ncbi:MAG: thiamine phosphate synthase [Rhodospirillales bacterium]
MTARAPSARDRCRLYLITPPKLEPEGFAEQLKRALDGGDVASVQLRLKGARDDDILRAIDALRPLAQKRDVAFILHDRPDLAADAGCDGVHVGQEDMGYAEARAIVGRDAIVGVTCHDSLHLAMDAAEQGADYVAFGAFFPTKTKDARYHATIELLEAWAPAMVVPCVAIGGITPENCAPLVEAGADFLAAASAVWDARDGPGGAVRRFNAAIDAASGR